MTGNKYIDILIVVVVVKTYLVCYFGGHSGRTNSLMAIAWAAIYILLAIAGANACKL